MSLKNLYTLREFQGHGMPQQWSLWEADYHFGASPGSMLLVQDGFSSYEDANKWFNDNASRLMPGLLNARTISPDGKVSKRTEYPYESYYIIRDVPPSDEIMHPTKLE